MSSVFKRSGSWYVRFKSASGAWAQEVSAARSREEAKRMAAELELKHDRIRRGLEVEPGDPSLTFGKLYDWYVTTHAAQLTSFGMGGKGYTMRKHIVSALGSMALREVTPQVLERLFDVLGKTLAASSVNTLRACVRAIYGRAKKRGLWLGENPAEGTERRKETRTEFDEISADEVPLVLREISDDRRPLFATAIFTGMRKGELAALRREDVDLEAGVIRIGRSWASNTTKGGTSKPIPIAAALRPYLETALAASKGSALVFPRPDGSMMRTDVKLAPMLRRALARAGLTRGWLHVCRRRGAKPCDFTERRDHDRVEPCPRCSFKLWPKPIHRQIRFHDTRASTASLLARSGASPAVAGRVLRHSDPSMTLAIYTRVREEDMRSALDAMLPGMAPQEPTTEPAQVEQRAAVNAENHAAPVLHGAQTRDRRAGEASTTAAVLGASESAPGTSRTCGLILRRTPGDGENGPPPRVVVLNGLRARGVTSASREPDASGSTRFSPARAAPVLQAVASMLSVRQVAAQLGVSTATVYDLIDRGELAHVRVSNAIRIAPAALAEYLAKGGKR